MLSVLCVRDYLLNARLGHSAEERKHAQKLFVSLKIEWGSPPKACATDALEDTVCYDKLCKSMAARVRDQEFRTVEHLGRELHASVREFLPREALLHLTLHKVQPPVDNLMGGVFFEIADRKPPAQP